MKLVPEVSSMLQETQPENELIFLLKTELLAYADPLTFSKHILGISLYPMQEEILRKFYEKQEDKQPKFTNLIITAGMRGTKSFIASLIVTFEAFKLIQLKKPWKFFHLAPGQEIFIVNVATSESQGLDTIFAATKARIENSPWFQLQKCSPQYNEYDFYEPHVKIRSEHSNSSSLAGKTSKLVALDETARFKDNSGKASSQMVYDTLSRSVRTFGREGFVVSVSSPIYHNDFQMILLKQCGTIYIKDNLPYIDMFFQDLERIGDSHYYRNPYGLDTYLGYWLATWELNPSVTRESLEADFRRNPESAMRDYHAVPSTAIEKYYREPHRITFDTTMTSPILSDGTLDKAFIGKRFKYVLAMDPAFKGDAMGISLAHVEGNKYIIDLAYCYKPVGENSEIQTTEVMNLIKTLLDRFTISDALSDTYQYPNLIQYIESRHVKFEQHFVKKADHDKLKEAFYQGIIQTYPNDALAKELRDLELIRGEKVDHPKFGSKDIADAVANAIYKLNVGVPGARKPAFTFFDIRKRIGGR